MIANAYILLGYLVALLMSIGIVSLSWLVYGPIEDAGLGVNAKIAVTALLSFLSIVPVIVFIEIESRWAINERLQAAWENRGKKRDQTERAHPLSVKTRAEWANTSAQNESEFVKEDAKNNAA